jgi:hypothetical protein
MTRTRLFVIKWIASLEGGVVTGSAQIDTPYEHTEVKPIGQNTSACPVVAMKDRQIQKRVMKSLIGAG